MTFFFNSLLQVGLSIFMSICVEEKNKITEISNDEIINGLPSKKITVLNEIRWFLEIYFLVCDFFMSLKIFLSYEF